ncbi:MAG TPA: ASPIC/UnbV domain-containing protein [Candidatus Sulfotelmatobacter sp.]|nr:ASPIC/UnbV domain-containing protein [Candidatus Sulfotelmatobacter sp.]
MGNGSELHFTEVAANMGIGQPSLQKIGWGTSFVDFDSDGWPDLLVVNGSASNRRTQCRENWPPCLPFYSGMRKAVSSMTWRPGIASLREGIRLLRNDIPQGNWVEVRLHNRVPPSRARSGFGDGATVIAWAGGVPLRRAVDSSSYLSEDSRRIHIGVGATTQIDRLEARWLRGRSETWTNLGTNQIWDLAQSDPEAKPFIPQTTDMQQTSAPAQLVKAALVLFWEKPHAAMDAMKREHDNAKAAGLFREALAINRQHEDSHHYLANCLVVHGDIPSAIAQLDETCTHQSPESSRISKEGRVGRSFGLLARDPPQTSRNSQIPHLSR